MHTLTIREALSIQEKELDLCCPKEGGEEYADDVRRQIIEATNIGDSDLDTQLPEDVVNRRVPRGKAIDIAIFNWKAASWTYEISEEDFESAFQAMVPLLNHYPTQFLFDDVILTDPMGINCRPHFYTQKLDGETKYFRKPSTMEEYGRIAGLIGD